MKSIADGNLASVLSLLESGADPNAIGPDGETALHEACQRGDVDCVRALLDSGAEKYNRVIVAFCLVIVLRLFLLQTGYYYQLTTRSNLFRFDFIQDEEGMSPFDYAVEVKSFAKAEACANELLRAGMDMKQATSGFVAAAVRGHVGILRKLCTAGIDVYATDDDYGFTALHFAAVSKNHRLECVEVLLDAGADINQRSRKHGMTPLMLVASSKIFAHDDSFSVEKDLEIAKLLIERGADVNIRGFRGTTALVDAIWRRKTELVRLLIDSGADVEAEVIQQPDGGFNFLPDAWFHEAVSIAQLVGLTPLMVAISGANEDAVLMLLQAGADVISCGTYQRKYAQNALMRACAQNNFNVCELVVRHLEHMVPVESLQLLIDLPDENGDTATSIFLHNIYFFRTKDRSIHQQASERYTALLQRMLSWRPELLWQSKMGFSTMHQAATCRYVEDLWDILIAAGARNKLEDNHGELHGCFDFS